MIETSLSLVEEADTSELNEQTASQAGATDSISEKSGVTGDGQWGLNMQDAVKVSNCNVREKLRDIIRTSVSTIRTVYKLTSLKRLLNCVISLLGSCPR